MSEQGKYSLAFGYISDPFLNQLEEQGFYFTTEQKKDIALIQKISDAILLLLIQGIISQSDMDKANRRMFRKLDKIMKDVKR